MKMIRALWSRLFRSETKERLARIDRNLDLVVTYLRGR